MKGFLLTKPPRRVWVPVALIMRIGRLAPLIGIFLLPGVAINCSAAAEQLTKTYRTREFAFVYPSLFRIATEKRGTVIRLLPRSRSAYWEDEITIRKHNKKTEECDLPQSTTPEAGPKRKIADRVAYGYSGEDAAMNRFVKTKGYVIETTTSCWRFELVRKGRPWQKFAFSKEEQKRLDKQSEQDAKAAEAAFKMILDSFVLSRQ